MSDYKILLYGEDTEAVSELVRICEKSLKLSPVCIAVFAVNAPVNIEELPLGVHKVVLGHKDKASVPKGMETLTYAADDSSADVVALNVQKREGSQSFEILFGTSMGRVFIPDGSKYTRDHVLVAVTLLCAFGVPMDKILVAINKLLK